MSIKIMTQVWALDLDHTKKIVLLALADNANDDGDCYPSIATITRKCGLSERTVQSVISSLEELGKVSRNFREGRSTVYTITPAGFVPPQTSHPAAPAPTPAAPAPPPPQSTTLTPAAPAPITSKKPSIESPRKRHRAPIDSRFAEIRQKYPKRGGAQNWDDAERGYLKWLNNGNTHEEMLAGVERYAEHIRAAGNEGTEYVKMASSFFGRNRCFLESFPVPVTKKLLSPVERVMLANGGGLKDERVVAEQRSNESMGDIFGDVRHAPHSGLRRIGS